MAQESVGTTLDVARAQAGGRLRRRTRRRLALAVGAAVLLPQLLAVELHRRHLEHEAEEATHATLDALTLRADEVLGIAARELGRLVVETGGRCTDASVHAMLDTAYRALVVREAGIFEAGRLVCTSWGVLPEPIAITPGKDRLSPDGPVLIPDVHSALGLSGISSALNQQAAPGRQIGVNVLIPQQIFTAQIALRGRGARTSAVLWTDHGMLAAVNLPPGAHPGAEPSSWFAHDEWIVREGRAGFDVRLLAAFPREAIHAEWLAVAWPGAMLGLVTTVFAALLVPRLVARRFDPCRELPAALAGREIRFRYEPIVRMDDQGIAGFEMLARWWHPEHGLLRPSRFLEALEDRRHAAALLLHALAEGMAARRQLGAEGAYLSINVPACALDEAGWIDAALARLHVAGVSPGWVQFELTERDRLDLGAAPRRATLERLRRAGFRLSLDDFGSGQNGLEALAGARFDQVKIDRSFLTALHIDERARIVMGTMADLAVRLSAEIVVEGVESDADVALLAGLGITHLQGYRFAAREPVA